MKIKKSVFQLQDKEKDGSTSYYYKIHFDNQNYDGIFILSIKENGRTELLNDSGCAFEDQKIHDYLLSRDRTKLPPYNANSAWATSILALRTKA